MAGATERRQEIFGIDRRWGSCSWSRPWLESARSPALDGDARRRDRLRRDRLTSLAREQVQVTRHPRTWLPWLWYGGRSVVSGAIGGVGIVRHMLAQTPRLRGPSGVGGARRRLLHRLRFDDAASAGGRLIEAGPAFSLHATRIPPAQALVATLVYRFFTLWLPILPAALAATQVCALDQEPPRLSRASIS